MGLVVEVCWSDPPSRSNSSSSSSSSMDSSLCGVVFWFGLARTTRIGTRVSKTRVPRGF